MIIDFHTHMFPDKIAGRTLDYLSGIFGACATDRGREGCHLFRKCKEIAGNIADRSKKRRLQNVDDTKNVKK